LKNTSFIRFAISADIFFLTNINTFMASSERKRTHAEIGGYEPEFAKRREVAPETPRTLVADAMLIAVLPWLVRMHGRRSRVVLETARRVAEVLPLVRRAICERYLESACGPYDAVHGACEDGCSGVFVNICNHHLSLRDTVFRQHATELLVACSSRRNIGMAKLLVERFGPFSTLHTEWAMFEACKSGETEMAEFVAEAFGLSPRVHPPSENIHHALQKAGWYDLRSTAPIYGDDLVYYFGIPNDSAGYLWYGRCLETACANGYVETARWVADRFGLSRDNVPSSIAGALFAVLVGPNESDHVLEWLVTHFRLTAEDIRAGDNALLRYACWSGKLGAVKRLVARFGLTRGDVCRRYPGDRMLCDYDDTPHRAQVSAWLVQTFGPKPWR